MTRRVLLVEDDTDARDALGLLLESEGYEIETASDGNSAVAIAESFRPDVLICDWLLPGTDGVAVARTLQHTSGVGVILVTAHSPPVLRASAKDLRVHAYLPKPIDVARLREALRAIAMSSG